MNKLLKTLKIAIIGLTILTSKSEACTRALYVGSDNVVITGRSMDWTEDMNSDLWVFPRGIKRDGAAGPHSVSWTSKYGSLIVSGYNAASADGMNEKGLVANLLYLTESKYGQPKRNTPVMSISLWAQYVLDNFSNVSEAVSALEKEPFTILAPSLPNGSPGQLHLSISDPSGDSAIFEYIDGKLVIHHGKQYPVMTNSPTFDKQLALNAYWESIGGLNFLPGTNRAADRFARVSFLLNSIPKKTDTHYIDAVPHQDYQNQALASMTGVIRSVSVPLGISTPGQPNIASTLWRTISDQKNKVYYFDSATSPNIFWTELKDLDFHEKAPIKKLALRGRIFSGNVASLYKEAKPFTFLPASPGK
ncbi:MAG: linear amide C-N hydrolase [Waddliaceae bacterium]